MERFSIAIPREQVYDICRLCGEDNPDKIPILGAENTIDFSVDDEPPLSKKIEQCVGIQVHMMDSMPQQICSLCVDKMNDFYEFRSMCAATDRETRRLLCLPLVHPSVSLVKADTEMVMEIPKVPRKRGSKPKTRKKAYDANGTECSEEIDSNDFSGAVSEKRTKYEYACQYCNDTYNENSDLERHLIVKHTPLVHKFGCGSCMEYFDTAADYKDHNLWHKLSRKMYSCLRCNKKFAKNVTLNKHMQTNVCAPPSQTTNEATLVPDMRCTLCQKVFKTRNLYEWHGCFIRARAHCPKCGKYFSKKNILLRHLILFCNGTLERLEPILMPKDEHDPVTANGAPDAASRRAAGGDGRKRGRTTGSMRGHVAESIELPFPPTMDDDVKSETTSIPDVPFWIDESLENQVGNERELLKSTLSEETDKIASLLRSGASVDGNSDIATLSSMLSSVNQAIATISKVRKRKKKRDRPSTGSAHNSYPPMVVLAMPKVKHEEYEDASLFTRSMKAQVGNNESVPNTTIVPKENDREEQRAETDSGDHFESAAGEPMSESFADDYDDDNTEENVDAAERAANSAVERQAMARKCHEPAPQDSFQALVQVKQEQESDDFENIIPGYTVYNEREFSVKQEPEDTLNNFEADDRDTATVVSFESSHTALRIKIKKEKGLHNASVVEKEGSSSEPAVDNGFPVERTLTNTRKQAVNTSESANAICQVRKKVNSAVQIKQEPLDRDQLMYEHTETSDGCFADDRMVRIKQERRNSDEFQNGTPVLPAFEEHESTDCADMIAFDGTRIKRERGERDAPGKKMTTLHTGPSGWLESYRKAYNPLSLSIGGSIKKPGPSQTSGSVPKSNVVINPFALLKQKTSIPDAAPEEMLSPDSSSPNARSDRFALPVISQVKSIDPEEHLLMPRGASVAADGTIANEPQKPALAHEVDESGHSSCLSLDKEISHQSVTSITTDRSVVDGHQDEQQRLADMCSKSLHDQAEDQRGEDVESSRGLAKQDSTVCKVLSPHEQEDESSSQQASDLVPPAVDEENSLDELHTSRKSEYDASLQLEESHSPNECNIATAETSNIIGTQPHDVVGVDDLASKAETSATEHEKCEGMGVVLQN